MEQHADLAQRVHEALKAANIPEGILVMAVVAKPNDHGGHSVFTVSNTGSMALDQELCREVMETHLNETMKLTQ